MHFHFCPARSSIVHFNNDGMAETIAIISVWETRRHEWVEGAGEVDHYD